MLNYRLFFIQPLVSFFKLNCLENQKIFWLYVYIYKFLLHFGLIYNRF